MDYVDDPGVLLKAMETNCIGTKQSLFYQAYALYYEKAKKYEEAEKMYHYGVQKWAFLLIQHVQSLLCVWIAAR